MGQVDLNSYIHVAVVPALIVGIAVTAYMLIGKIRRWGGRG